MLIKNANIYNDGVRLDGDSEEKIRQIINTLTNLSPASEINFRFLKSGRTYEGLIWGKTKNIPIGAYNKGLSIHHVLEILHKRIQRDCLKIMKSHPEQLELAMAG